MERANKKVKRGRRKRLRSKRQRNKKVRRKTIRRKKNDGYFKLFCGMFLS